MVKAYPAESRRDVIAVARKGETSVRQVAALLQQNDLNRKRWATPEELRLAIITRIETSYRR